MTDEKEQETLPDATLLSPSERETSRPPHLSTATDVSIPRAGATGFPLDEQWVETARLVGKLSFELKGFCERAEDDRDAARRELLASREERASLRAYIASRAQKDEANWELIRGSMRRFEQGLEAMTLRLDAIDSRLREGENRFDENERQISKLRDFLTAFFLFMAPRRSTEARLEGLLILLLEDDVVLRNALARVCEQEGARVFHAPTVEAGLDAIEKEGISVAAVDINLNAPQDGMLAVRDIRANHPHVGVFIITGSISESQQIEADALGVPVLHKPFETDKLIEAIRAARAS